ncbi:protein DWARF 53-LIKE-like [Musa acuminata AAA Group]|uniref:protein DWARF 53-LIKE-like n=1 Tax=Musa acuminata AAA Group TaxID=214697 RepID=UPI0031DC1640
MPTPVSSARACLAAEAAAALDNGVTVARRRSHAQTTSLHVVYSLLSSTSSSSPPSSYSSSASCSILRDALSRARSAAYSPRLQFKALELCFGVALDRLPSGQRQNAEGGGDEPPVSNSLMAAIKRSQANQRRNPDTFHLYQQQQQQGAATGGASSFSGVKVELQQLMLAILDDPVVSRVFGDAGFRSADIKFAILRPPPPILRFPRAARRPPLFLCNFSAGDGFEPALAPRGLVLPFAAAARQLSSDGGDENCRRIGEILARKSGGRNPMLVGVGAGEAASDFSQVIERQNWAILPPELRGIELVSIEKVVAELRTDHGDRLALEAGLEEVGRKAESSGVVLNIGDLKGMVEGGAERDESESCLVSELTRLLEVYHGRLWVMGWSATYETYMKFLSRHPLLDKDWDLQLLPISSVRTGVGNSLPKPRSFMESFSPIGGGVPIEHESYGVYPSVSRCEDCNDKCEQEVSIVLKGKSASVDDQQNASLPFWLQKGSKVSLNDGFDAAKAKDDTTFFNAKIMELQKKWNENCQRLHHSCQTNNIDNCSTVPRVIDPSCVSNMGRAFNQNSENLDDAQSQRGFGISFPISAGTQTITTASQSISMPSVLEQRNKDLLSKLQVRASKSEQPKREELQPHHGDDHASPSSVTSVMTNLVLGTLCEPVWKEENPASQVQKNPLVELSGCLPSTKVDVIKQNVPDVPVMSLSFSGRRDSQATQTYPHDLSHSFSQVSKGCASACDRASLISSGAWQKLDLGSYKSFCASLIEKVGRQEEAAIAISQAIVHCRTGERHRGASLRGDIWLSFHGPDKIGKKRAAVAIAEMLCGSKENFVHVDLSYQEGVARPGTTICAQQEVNGNYAQFRDKINVDHIAAELRKKPQSVVFLENVDKADFLVQDSLSKAINTGKFPDSHGREFSINNAIFILTSATIRGQTFSQRTDCNSFSEETILAAQCWQMKISWEPSREAVSSSPKSNKVSSASSQKPRNAQVYLRSGPATKRKLDMSDGCNSQYEVVPAKRARKTSKEFLDLNLPIEEVGEDDNDSSSQEDCSKSENSGTWMEDSFNLVDATVKFGPFDFDALADSILNDISKIFCTAAGSDCILEIDTKVMEEILAVAWSSEDRGALNSWFEQVLGRSFVELKHKHNLSSHKILRLVACEDAIVAEHAPGVLLPSRIILN